MIRGWLIWKSCPFFTTSSSFSYTGYLFWKTFCFWIRTNSISYGKKNLPFVASNRYKFQIKDKMSLLILNVQNIVFNGVKVCVLKIYLDVLNRFITFHIPAVICHNFYVSSSFLSFLHCLYILVESLPLFIANITKIFRELIQVAVKKCALILTCWC